MADAERANQAATPVEKEARATPPKRRRRPFILALKILLWTIVSLIVLVLLVFGFLQTEPGRNLVRDITVDVLNGALKGRVEVDRIGGFLPFDARVEGFRVFDPDGRKVLSVASVTADFHPWDLLDNKVRLSNVVVERPEVMIFDEDNSLALLRAFEPRDPSPDTTASPWLIAFEGIRLDQGTVERILPGPQDLSLADLRLDLTLALGPEGLEWPLLALRGTPTGNSELAEIIGGELIIATRGGISDGGVRIEALEVDVGGHRLHANGFIGLGGEAPPGSAPVEVKLDISALRIDLSRLPAGLRERLVTQGIADPESKSGTLSGSGAVALARNGAVRLDLGFDLPLGLVNLAVGGDIDFAAATAETMIGDWAASLHLVDGLLPSSIADQLPVGARGKRVELIVKADGRRIPPGRGGDGGRLHVELEVFETTIDVEGEGYLSTVVDRVADDPGDQAPTFLVSTHLAELGLQPWLELVGEPALIGEVKNLQLEGRIALPADGLPRVAALASFQTSVDGTLRAVDPPVALRASNVEARASVRWEGVGVPTGRLDLEGTGLGFDIGAAESVSMGFDLIEDGGKLSVVGTLTAVKAAWGDVSVGRVEVPISLGLDELMRGELPAGRVRWTANNLRAGARSVASTSGDLTVAPERGGLRVRGAVVTGEARVDAQTSVGSADLKVDVWLAPAAEAPVGGPISGRIDGTVARLRQGANRVESVELIGLVVDVPLGPDGLSGRIAAVGTVKAGGLRIPGATVARLEAELDAELDTRTMEATGRADIKARDVLVETGQFVAVDGTSELVGKVQRLAVVDVKAVAKPGGVIALDGFASQEPSKTDTPSLDAKFSGQVVLPSRRRALAATLNSLVVTRQGDLEPTLVIGRTTYEAGGWITLESLVLRSARRAGAIQVSGRFRPTDEAIELSVQADDLSLARWGSLVRDVFQWLDLDAAPLGDFAKDVEGRVALSLDARGTLSAPELNVRMRVGGLRYKEHRDGFLDLSARTSAGRIEGDLSVRWHANSSFAVHAALPATLSLSPPGLTWADDEQLELEVRLEEPDLDRTRAIAQTILPSFRSPGIAGSVDFLLRVTGTAMDPRLTTTLLMDDLDLSPTWKDGRLTLEGSSRDNASGFRVEVVDAQNRTQMQVDIQLPFAVPRAIREADPVAWMRGRLDDNPFLVEVTIPPFVVHETPLATLIPPEFADLAADVDMRIGGTFKDPVVRGHAALKSPESLPIDLGFRIDVETEDTGLVHSRLAVVRPGGDTLLEGSLFLPQLSTILRTPERLPEVMKDPQLSFELFSSEIRSIDFWELKGGLGDLFAQLFPDGWLMLNASAKGGVDGLTAGVYLRVRTTAPPGYVAPALDDPTAVRRNAADDVRLALTIADKTSMSLVMTQDTRALTPSLGVHVVLGVSGQQLVAGSYGKLDDIPIEVGRIQGGEFRLEGFAGVFKSVLGNSGGSLSGELLVSGTLGSPRFEKGLRAQFAPFIVAPLGLEHDNATVTLNFEEGTRWRLEVTELYAMDQKVRTKDDYCGVKPRTIGAVDYTSHPYLTVALSGDMPRPVPRLMTLEGCIGMKDYPLLRKKDMTGRIDGSLQLSGTVAAPAIRGELTVVDAMLAPELASKSVRPIGTPLDVTLVRGDPVPPAVRVTRNPYKTGLALDINVILPKDVVRVEPSLTQPFGEVRALLYPTGSVRIRTIAGELSLVGTIEVPKETVFLYGKTFSVDPESRLVFTGDMATDPQLFFTARYNIAHIDLSSIGLASLKDSEVVVRVTGSPSAPRLEFSSTPSMDETNILSVITLGVPAGGGEALGDAVQSQLLTAVMGMATLQFARDFQQRLALDVLRIEARSSNPTDTRLTAGKRLAEDLTLNYYLNLVAREGEDQQSGSLEYRFTRYLSLLARAGDAGDVGLEFNLRFQDSPPPPRTAPRRRERSDQRPRKDPEQMRRAAP